ncbi:phosphatase PAP2 family protein [Saccharomonospora piscinae]|uniref:phosphatase PAP2 family protein n=1 Tax=Saccharomonospora piscinae TaxID=687388 RepID=UPI001FC8F7ED|nr:phosphatase PAP2 family protein [Saccharomonospora piscinae]
MRGAATACGALALVLGMVVAGQRGPSEVDRVFESWVHEVAGGPELWSVLVAPTEPWAVLTVLAVVVGVAVVRRRPAVAALAVAAPALAVSLTTLALKPAFDRYYDDHLAYPSGHTVSLVATVTVVVLVCGPRGAVATAVTGVLLTGGAAVGMAGLGYHYVTDVVGGAATAVALTLGVAVALRRWTHRRATEHPAGRLAQPGDPTASRASEVSLLTARRYFLR